MNVIEDFKQGEWPLSAAKLSQANAIVRSVRTISAVHGTGLRVTQGETGTVIGPDSSEALRISPPFLAVVVSTGPKSEADFTDERYWVKKSFIDGQMSDTNTDATPRDYITTSYDEPKKVGGDGPDKDDYVEPFIICATNLDELNLDKEAGNISARQSGTHAIPAGVHVWVWTVYDTKLASDPRFFFERPPYRPVVCRVTGEADGGGKYEGKLVTLMPGADVDSTTNLSFSDYGTTGADCIILNAAEEGQSTHDLTDGSPISRTFPGVLLWRKSADEGWPVVLINGYDFGDCT